MSQKTAQRAAEKLMEEREKPLQPGLYLVATPIGNLADITLRALAVLSNVDVIYCEDTRHSRTLMKTYGLTVRLMRYDDHASSSRREKLLDEIKNGLRVALISDAGSPLISDPGFKLAREAANLNLTVAVLPGPSAVICALSLSGQPSDSFFFAGFLPNKQAARKSRLAALASVPGSLIFFESPARVVAALADMADILGPRPAALARELTKRFEEVLHDDLPSLASRIANKPVKGEIVIVIAPPAPDQKKTDAELLDALKEAHLSMSLRDAVRHVSERYALPRSRVYKLGLTIPKEQR